jgi:tRNA threonylcarbamoyl adenosine modification protein YeaZ
MKTNEKGEMLILGLDTCGETASAALFDGSDIIGEIKIKSGRSHSVIVTAMISDLFALCRKERSDLSGIAVSVGPGSYTGVRIGVAAAKGLSLALGVPVAPVSSLLAAIPPESETDNSEADNGETDNSVGKDGGKFFAVTKKARGDFFYAAVYKNYKTIIPDMITNAEAFEKLKAELPKMPITVDGGKITAAGVIRAAFANPELFGDPEKTNAVYLEPTKAEKDLLG